MIVCAENSKQAGRDMKKERESIAKSGARTRQCIPSPLTYYSYDQFRVLLVKGGCCKSGK